MKKMSFDISPVLETGSLESGVVYAANESRFASQLSTGLTQYTVGWRDPQNVDALLDRLFPAVPNTPLLFEYGLVSAKEGMGMPAEGKETRAAGADFHRIELRMDKLQGRVPNKGFVRAVDHQDVPLYSASWRNDYVDWLMRLLLRVELRAGLRLLDSGSQRYTADWTQADCSPDADLEALIDVGETLSGIRPNRLALPRAVWNARKNVYAARNTPYAGQAVNWTPEQLAAQLGLDEIVIVDAQALNSAGVFAPFMANKVYAYFAIAGQLRDDPSHVKRFLSPIEGSASGDWGVFVEEKAVRTEITVQHNSLIKATSQLKWPSLDVTLIASTDRLTPA